MFNIVSCIWLCDAALWLPERKKVFRIFEFDPYIVCSFTIYLFFAWFCQPNAACKPITTVVATESCGRGVGPLQLSLIVRGRAWSGRDSKPSKPLPPLYQFVWPWHITSVSRWRSDTDWNCASSVDTVCRVDSWHTRMSLNRTCALDYLDFKHSGLWDTFAKHSTVLFLNCIN